MSDIACGNCHFYDSENRLCTNPNRDDSKQPYFYGYIGPTDYCVLFVPAVNNDVETENTSK